MTCLAVSLLADSNINVKSVTIGENAKDFNMTAKGMFVHNVGITPDRGAQPIVSHLLMVSADANGKQG